MPLLLHFAVLCTEGVRGGIKTRVLGVGLTGGRLAESAAAMLVPPGLCAYPSTG